MYLFCTLIIIFHCSLNYLITILVSLYGWFGPLQITKLLDRTFQALIGQEIGKVMRSAGLARMPWLARNPRSAHPRYPNR